MVPLVGCDFASSMRCILEQVVLSILFSIRHSFDLRVYGNHRLAKTIELVLRFALRWLDHHGAADRPRDRWRVKAVIHQTFCRIFDLDTSALPLAQIDNTFMRH